MNHSDPQLKDTPTCAEDADPESPDRTSSKYRRFTASGILFGAYRGMHTPSVGIRNDR